MFSDCTHQAGSSKSSKQGKRVMAERLKEDRLFDDSNISRRLRQRETGTNCNVSFQRKCAPAAFHNWKLQHEFDAYSQREQSSFQLAFLKKRTRVVEIVAGQSLIFALAHSGVCAAFCQDTNRRICLMNTDPEEVIRSIFYNKKNLSLITVSVYARDSFSSLKCRTTSTHYIKRGRPQDGHALFESESLKWPGFVEFDDVNGKVLTYSTDDRSYKVFDLKNYNLLYCIPDENVQEIKISPGIMLLIFLHAADHVPLKILSVETGELLKSFKHNLVKNKKVDFIEQFNEKLLVKQENENLEILDVRTGEVVTVHQSQFMTPSAFIFLYENQLFLTFRARSVHVWNFKGQLVTVFEDHVLWYPDCNTNNIYITSDQRLIISYCKATRSNEQSGRGAASINVSDILTGKCLAKIQAGEKREDGTDEKCSTLCNSSVEAALADITSLFYDEERNEIYTGNRYGLVHVWSS